MSIRTVEQPTSTRAIEACPLERWQTECPTFRVVEGRDKQPIYREGEDHPYLFCVMKGYVKLSRLYESGAEFTLGLLKTGDLFGPTLSNPADAGAQETATAKGEVRLARVHAADFQRLLALDPEIVSEVIRTLAHRQRLLEQRVAALLFHDVRARVARLLCDLAGRFGERCPHGLELDIRVTQQELADLAGASRSVVSTLVNEWRDQGILAYTREFICIVRIDALRRLIPS